MSKYPLIKFVILFMIGIIFQSILSIPLITLLIFFSSALFISVIFHYLKSTYTEQLKVIPIIIAILLCGSLYYSVVSPPKVRYPFHLEKYTKTLISGTIDNIELKKEGRIILYLSADTVTTKEQKFQGTFKILCSVYDEDRKTSKLFDQLEIGNRIQIFGNIIKPRNERNPGEFDYEKYLSGKGIVAIANIYKTDDVKFISKEVSVYKNTIHQIRKKLDEQITSLHNKTTAGLLRGLLLADQGSIDYVIKNEFINSGVVHVLSVSGLHVGYIVLIFLVVFNRFNIFTRYTLTLIGLLFYLIITGADAPVFRSTVMAVALLAAPAMGREYNSLNALSLSAFIILLISPNELFNPSFQLSFSAILSLILIYPPMKRAVDNMHIKIKWLNWFLVFCVTSLSAQIGTLPFTLTYFHRLSVSALLANLVVIPVSGAIVALGIFTLFIGSIFSWFGSVFASANELLTYVMYFFVRLMGGDKYSYIFINQFSVYDAILFYLVLAFIFFILKIFTNRNAKIAGVTLSVVLWIMFMRLDNYELMPKNILSVTAVDVGQGDGLLVKFPNGKTALIDAGEATEYFDNGERVILPLMDKLGIDKIDYGFISHVDSDHYKGFLSIIKKHRIKFIYKPKLDPKFQKDIDLEKMLSEEGVPFQYYSKQIIPIGNSRIYVLNDTTNHYFESMSSNDQSGMLKLVYGNNSFLFTGDASTKVESDYVSKYKTFLQSDVLKAGHHGSRSSTSEEFLDFVKPNYAIISAGVMNKFNHPHKDIIERFNQNKINIVRTDKSGGIMFRSDGYKIEEINWKKVESTFNL
ncbi:MAG: DNA internalization-related competence protein ComEC/Rec2 [Ignavibacteriales bacterium]|nr:DNA internalization-related competence protein ComEC/Rec2 [Ignavibacteriales bacterium]